MLRALRPRSDDTLYARATPQKVELAETYSVEQEISRNPKIQEVGEGTGRLEISVPYDGNEYFTRQAIADVERVVGPRAEPGERRAMIGHLLLADHAKTNGLRAAMRPHNQAGLIPLSVPVATHDGNLDLSGDRQACVTTYDYQFESPSVYPVELDVKLDDRDSLFGAFDVARAFVRPEPGPSKVLEQLRQSANFSSQLLLLFTVRISIPIKENYPSLVPVVKNMSVEWPTLTSLRSTELHIENFAPKDEKDRMRAATVRYNPVKSRLEWKNVAMREDREGSGAGMRIYESAAILLKIGHPGEFFKEDMLEVNALVEVPGYLLSGLEARLLDATGRGHARQPKLTTKLNITTQVYPADIFASREFWPYQQFVFDDIKPDEERITHIANVLRTLKFTVDEPLRPERQDRSAPTWLLHAHRSQGPDTLDLWVAVEGKHTVLDHEQFASRTDKYTGRKESGQLKVSVLATLPRNHKELTRELNALQQGLRARLRPQ